MSEIDIEKAVKGPIVQEGSSTSNSAVVGDVQECSSFASRFEKWTTWTGAEQRGAAPIPVELRTQTDYISVFTVFFTPMLSLLPIGIGSATTLGYGMSLTTAALMTICLQVLFAIPAAYVITIAPQTGMRQMIQFRYVFGKYGNIVTACINVMTVGGYGITASITGGQCLSRVQDGKLPIEGGIAIVLIIGMILGFLGYKFIHLIMKWYWIVTLFALIVLVGCAGDQLYLQSPPSGRPPQAYLGMVALAAGNMISWANVVGDYACYMPPNAPKFRIGAYLAAGISISFSLLMVLGAAIAGAVHQIPSWEAAYTAGGMGGVLGEILIHKLGDFGRFILVLLGFSVFGVACRDIYTISIALPAVIPLLRKVPRVLLAIVASGVLIAIAIPASRSFVATIKSFLSIVGYYVGASVSCFLLEWLYFRGAKAETLNPEIWDNGSMLPSGIPAVISVIMPWAFIIPSMDTAWYTGPIARVTGDIAFEFSVVVGILCYFPLRSWEIKRNGSKLNRDGIF